MRHYAASVGTIIARVRPAWAFARLADGCVQFCGHGMDLPQSMAGSSLMAVGQVHRTIVASAAAKCRTQRSECWSPGLHMAARTSARTSGRARPALLAGRPATATGSRWWPPRAGMTVALSSTATCSPIPGSS